MSLLKNALDVLRQWAVLWAGHKKRATEICYALILILQVFGHICKKKSGKPSTVRGEKYETSLSHA